MSVSSDATARRCVSPALICSLLRERAHLCTVPHNLEKPRARPWLGRVQDGGKVGAHPFGQGYARAERQQRHCDDPYKEQKWSAGTPSAQASLPHKGARPLALSFRAIQTCVDEVATSFMRWARLAFFNGALAQAPRS